MIYVYAMGIPSAIFRSQETRQISEAVCWAINAAVNGAMEDLPPYSHTSYLLLPTTNW
jgi:hypothetical protein